MGKVKTSPFSDTYTFEAYPLGTIRHQDAHDVVVEAGNSGTSTTVSFPQQQGPREWVFVYAVGAVAAGDLCEFDEDGGVAYYVQPADTADLVTHLLVGVADNAIAASSYGWICKRGTVVVKAASDVAAGELLAASGTSGTVDDDGAAGTAIGVALTAYSGSTTATLLTGHCEAYINIP